jgi:hypothetical protein
MDAAETFAVTGPERPVDAGENALHLEAPFGRTGKFRITKATSPVGLMNRSRSGSGNCKMLLQPACREHPIRFLR